jgi:ABC-type transport system involved in cytochrome c biogenesis permease subunit
MSARAGILALLLAAPLLAQGSDADRAKLDLTEIRRLPVLSGTRFQPLESYAREVVLLVTGQVEPKRKKDGSPIRRGEEGAGRRGDPLLTYLEWWLMPAESKKIPWILIQRPRTRELLGFPSDKAGFDHVSEEELTTSHRVAEVVDQLRKRPRESYSLEEAEVGEIDGRVRIFRRAALLKKDDDRKPAEMRTGPQIIPPNKAMERGVLYEWAPVAAVRSGLPDFQYDEAQRVAIEDAFARLKQAFLAADGPAFTAASIALRESIAALRSPNYPELATMDREVRYHLSHWFDHAAWMYLLSAILAIFALIWRNRVLHVAAAVPGLIGLGMNAYGMAERTALSGRAMLGNLYETLLYVGGVAFVLAIVCEVIFRSRWFLATGSLLAMGFLKIAQGKALFMQPQISTLQPVLDNNFWIHIHVPVIVASYAPLALAALMGNVYLLLAIFRPASSPALKEVGRIQYWAMVPGVILLFAGLILGGIWADQSWGRFWGWDPKETWGLITWAVFVVLIHGRWAGWLRDYGTAVGTMIGGASLIMTYWGVNFMLAGKHSYASANDLAAGLGWWERIPLWIKLYVAFEVLLIGVAAFFRKRAPAPGGPDEPPALEEADVIRDRAPVPAAKT